ncbi:MAG: hypothetical protein IJU68_06725 [Bacteroidales bacterium]|nr:hypothetical protein [Bacteroidales bacterium]
MFAPMPNQIPEIAYLIQEVEKKYGRKVNTSTDFESLSVVIERDINEYISASTLKRMWGYVTLKPEPRVSTLDLLSRFIGYSSFAEFRKRLQEMPDFDSGFFSTRCIASSELQAGDVVQIGWAPNRLVTLEYLGNYSYRVVKSENAKLRPGDVFAAAQFMLGYPLFIDQISRPEGPTPSYVAGKTGGLNRLERVG